MELKRGEGLNDENKRMMKKGFVKHWSENKKDKNG